jgi:hypothetical protein
MEKTMSRKKSSQVYEGIQEMLVVYAQQANQWAQFSKRETEINAETFVQTLVLGWLKKKDASLNELAHAARDLGLAVTGSALHERMGQEAVMLLAGVLKLTLEALRKASPLPLTLLQKFSGVYITDSSQIALATPMASIFRGNQANSMLKLQVTWDYLHGNLAALELDEGRSPDQKCQLHVRHAQAGTLQLFDLGYFKQEYLRDIDEQGAYFVSRYQSQTALYHPETGSCLALVSWLKTVTANETQRRVLLGGRVKWPLRLLARRLSQQAADARRRKAKQKARQQGKTCSAAYLFLLGWDILVTNLEAANWTLAQIFDLYPLRFQIEWLFRVWKDQLGVDELGGWRVERILCQLYAHLLAALLTHLLTASYRWAEVEYSFAKSVRIIQTAVTGLMRCLARAGWGFATWLKRLEEDFRTFACKTKRRKSPSTAQIIYNWGLS